MAFASGKAGVFKLDNAGGALTDLSAYIDSVDAPHMADTLETTTFGKNSKTKINGLKDGSFSIKGPWDPTLDAHMTAIVGHTGTKSFEYGPAGSTVPLPKRTGECVLTNYSVSTPVAGRVEWTAELQHSDDVTFGAYA